MLAESMNLPLSKHDALIRIWGEDSYHNGRSMDVYIAKLRKYLQFDADIHIMNIHGLGYKLSILS
jgi:DNA-binding response OmpR family regulator